MTMADAVLEQRLTTMLRAKSAQVEVAPEAFEPHLGRLVIDEPRRPRRRAVLVAAVLVAVLAVAVGVTVLLTEDDATQPAGPPPDAPVSQLLVVATPELRFQHQEFTTEPGLNEIEFWSSGGTHGLGFADPALATIELGSSGTPERAVVELEAGRDYTIFCPIDGHRNAGLEAVIHVTDGPSGPTRGSMPEPLPTRPDGSTDASRMPDYLAVATSPTSRGWGKWLDLFGSMHPPDVKPVYADDLTTVIGHMYPGRGFVRLGTDPETVPEFPSTTTPAVTSP